MKKYTFISEDGGTKNIMEFETESDSWCGYDGPVYNFFMFLKGCGFTFGEDGDMGVVMTLRDKPVFMSSDEHNGTTEISFE